MKVWAIIKGIISYIVALIFATIFALFLNANVGWFILLALILAPVISVLFAWLASRLITVSGEMEEVLLSKGDKCSMTIRVRNAGIFPTPPIEISLTNAPGIRREGEDWLVSVLPGGTVMLKAVFRAKICGLSEVGIEQVRVSDYLGLFSFAVKKADCEILRKKVAVIPDIAEFSAKDELLLKTMQMSAQGDDSEDTVESVVNTFGGMPGYTSRDYVPGDPLKRINWKQSAKRGRLLVRMDDERAAVSVGVVLDSVFGKKKVAVKELAQTPSYKEIAEDEMLPKIAEDAIENALGIMQVLIRQEYKVNFYMYCMKEFICHELETEVDLERIRLELASYCFHGEEVSERFPKEALPEKGSGSVLFVTPNSQAEASLALGDISEQVHTSIYSVQDEAKKQQISGDVLSWKDFKITARVQLSVKEKVEEATRSLTAPFLLALLLSASVFTLFEVSFGSWWTVLQVFVCAVAFGMGEYAKKHKFKGGLLITVSVLWLLRTAGSIVFSGGSLLDYMHWFLSGGESVETRSIYLLSLLLVFTPFFAWVVYYFTRILYRTSFLMLISLVPLVIYVKVMQEVNMIYVVLITVLNVTAFLLHAREKRDAEKYVTGRLGAGASLGIYLLILVLAGFSAPEQEDAKYYYLFETLFMGGNVSEEVPAGYSALSEHSGNAEGLNSLNNRKLYEVSVDAAGASVSYPLYLKRQNFNLYDFEQNHWYSSDAFARPEIPLTECFLQEEYTSVKRFSESLQCVEAYEPGFLERYGLEHAAGEYTELTAKIEVEATNYPSQAYIVPLNTIGLSVFNDYDLRSVNSYVTKRGEFQLAEGYLDQNAKYSITYREESVARQKWIALGGADMDSATALIMLEEMAEVLKTYRESEYLTVVNLCRQELLGALEYSEMYAENTAEISDSVRELAWEIAGDCTYDWEKAQALQRYFCENDFVYDLSYKAPDDSVEYFLFESKTGTCSDYASAYVLMARSLGLIVRYTEGFVPQMEYAGQYVIRTDCGHAYPEVYIQNLGFVEYEATNPARFSEGARGNSGFLSYFMTVGVRVMIILALLCAVSVSILLVVLILGPACAEACFKYKLGKASSGQAIAMVYKRIRDGRFVNEILRAGSCTPYEYAAAFEERVGYDISELAIRLERNVYNRGERDAEDKMRALAIYEEAKKAIRTYKKKEKKKKNNLRRGKLNDKK